MRRLLAILITLTLALAACGGGSDDDKPTSAPDGITVDEVLGAFSGAGLPVPNQRDNTPQNCPSLGCTKLLTSDAVSIYQWPDDASAKDFASKSKLKAHRNIVLRFPPLTDPAGYEAAVSKL